MFSNGRFRSTASQQRESRKNEQMRVLNAREQSLYREMQEARQLDALEMVRREEAAAELAGKRGDVRILLAEQDEIRNLRVLRFTDQIRGMFSHQEVIIQLRLLGHEGREAELLAAVKAHPFPSQGFRLMPGKNRQVVAFRGGIKYLQDVSAIRKAFIQQILSGRRGALRRIVTPLSPPLKKVA